MRMYAVSPGITSRRAPGGLVITAKAPARDPRAEAPPAPTAATFSIFLPTALGLLLCTHMISRLDGRKDARTAPRRPWPLALAILALLGSSSCSWIFVQPLPPEHGYD